MPADAVRPKQVIDLPGWRPIAPTGAHDLGGRLVAAVYTTMQLCGGGGNRLV